MAKNKFTVPVFFLTKKEIIEVFEKWIQEFADGKHRNITKKEIKRIGALPIASQYAEYFLKLTKKTARQPICAKN